MPELLYIASCIIYLIVSTTVKLWTIEKGRGYMDSHPDVFNCHSIPFYVGSWLSFWTAPVVGIFTDINPWIISAVAIIIYKFSNLTAAYRLRRKHPFAL